jgi:uncharacterized membrane protein
MNRFLEYMKHVDDLRQIDERKKVEVGSESAHLQIVQKNNPMSKMAKKKINIWVTTITVAILIISAFGKILGIEVVAEKLNKVGVGKFMILLGVVELIRDKSILSIKGQQSNISSNNPWNTNWMLVE